MANWTSSALVLIPSSSIMLYLWKATVLGVIARVWEISFIVRPSASSCRTSRCRMVNCAVPRAGPHDGAGGLEQLREGLPEQSVIVRQQDTRAAHRSLTRVFVSGSSYVLRNIISATPARGETPPAGPSAPGRGDRAERGRRSGC